MYLRGTDVGIILELCLKQDFADSITTEMLSDLGIRWEEQFIHFLISINNYLQGRTDDWEKPQRTDMRGIWFSHFCSR